MTKSKPTFDKILVDLLKKEKEFLDQDGDLHKQVVIDSAWNIDERLIKILLKNKDTKKKFFSEIENHWIFNASLFTDYLSQKSFLDDSYTRFKNKIGLNIDGKFLNQRDEISLVWPFKDCVLEGGQNDEESKRKEIFFNEILAQDEIDKLFDPKVITNTIKYKINSKTKKAKSERVVKFKRNEEGAIEDNLVIKGNNLLALHSLKNQFAGKIKLIYIDPPYNTGNDSFTYNDNFNHSTWLTFMKNRLEIAKDLLSDDGSIFISIDNNEVAYLQVLMDELFGVLNKRNLITIKRSAVSGAKVINPGLVNVSEFIIVYSKNIRNWNVNRVFRERERDTRYSNYIINFNKSPNNWKFCTVLDAWADFLKIEKKQIKKHFGDSYEEELEKFYYNNVDRIFQFVTLDEKSVSDEVVKVKHKSLKEPLKIFHIKREGRNDYYIHKGKAILFLANKLVEIDGELVFSEPLSDIWNDVLPNDLHTEGGVSLKKGKKPEKLIQRILELTTNKGDIVLDYHAGTGTTGAVAHKMGRQYILVEQMDYIHDLPEARLVNVIEGDRTGISKSVNWKGGGEFVYLELKKYNESFVEQIRDAKKTKILLEIWEDMKKKSFLNWNVDLRKQNEAMEEFKNITLDQQKSGLIQLLSKNQLYVNMDDIDDKDFEVSVDDKKNSKDFYNQ